MNEQPFNEEKLKEFVESFDSLLEVHIDEQLTKHVFKGLAEVEGFMEYLRRTMGSDVKRAFTSPKEQREYLEGHFAFAAFLYNGIRAVKQSELQKDLKTKKK